MVAVGGVGFGLLIYASRKLTDQNTAFLEFFPKRTSIFGLVLLDHSAVYRTKCYDSGTELMYVSGTQLASF